MSHIEMIRKLYHISYSPAGAGNQIHLNDIINTSSEAYFQSNNTQ